MQTAHDPRINTIIREARISFVSDGYAAAKMEPIARSAGVSTATLYSFFPSKTVLFEAVIEAASKEFYDRINSVESIDAPNRDQLTEFLCQYAEFLSDGFVRKMFRLVMAERHRFGEGAVAFFDTGRGDISKHLIALIDDLVEQGELKVTKTSWAITQLLGMIEYPLLLLPLASDKDPVRKRSARDIVTDAVETFWQRYGTHTQG